MINKYLKIKIDFIFIIDNFRVKIIHFRESFQHENVFATLLTTVRFLLSIIYLNLTFEVKLYAQKLNFNSNKPYEKNAKKVPIFIVITTS
jgi:hypothetical protein